MHLQSIHTHPHTHTYTLTHNVRHARILGKKKTSSPVFVRGSKRSVSIFAAFPLLSKALAILFILSFRKRRNDWGGRWWGGDRENKRIANRTLRFMKNVKILTLTDDDICTPEVLSLRRNQKLGISVCVCVYVCVCVRECERERERE